MELNLSTIGILLVIYGYSVYAGVIKKKNKVEEAFSSIDVQLKKRYDLIPNILTIASKFMEHEKSLMEDITNLRTKALNIGKNYDNINSAIEIDKQISQKMEQIIISAENYPQLKSDETMLQAMKTYNEVEEHIAAARRFFNAAALELKNAVEIFPSSFIAQMLNIKATAFFTIEDKERETIEASNYLK